MTQELGGGSTLFFEGSEDGSETIKFFFPFCAFADCLLITFFLLYCLFRVRER